MQVNRRRKRVPDIHISSIDTSMNMRSHIFVGPDVDDRQMLRRLANDEKHTVKKHVSLGPVGKCNGNGNGHSNVTATAMATATATATATANATITLVFRKQVLCCLMNLNEHFDKFMSHADCHESPYVCKFN